MRTKRRLGELLAEMPKNEGAKGTGSNQYEVYSQPVSAPPALKDLGISYNESSRAQAIASIPEPIFEQIVAEHTANVPDMALRVT